MHLHNEEIINLMKKSVITDLSVLVTGGDVRERKRIRDMCITCFNNELNLDERNFVTAKLYYLFQIIKNKIFVLKPAFKMVSNKEKEKG